MFSLYPLTVIEGKSVGIKSVEILAEIAAKLDGKFLVIDMTGFGTGVVFKLTRKSIF